MSSIFFTKKAYMRLPSYNKYYNITYFIIYQKGGNKKKLQNVYCILILLGSTFSLLIFYLISFLFLIQQNLLFIFVCTEYKDIMCTVT